MIYNTVLGGLADIISGAENLEEMRARRVTRVAIEAGSAHIVRLLLFSLARDPGLTSYICDIEVRG